MHRGAQSGFTLVEVMVVLAMISILITLATPMFVKYRAKALRSEVQTSMSALRSHLEAKRGDSGGYTDNLLELGFVPEGSPRFLYGFTSDKDGSGINDTAELRSVVGGFATDNMINSAGLPLTQADLPSAPVTDSSYVIGAVGEVDGDPELDEWTLDKTAGFANVSDDID